MGLVGFRPDSPDLSIGKYHCMNYINTAFIRPTRCCSFLRSTLLLTVGLFLLGAPAPDAASIAELTANFVLIPGL